MLYRSTDRLCRCGAPMKNLSHSASFESLDKNAPLKSGTKHLSYWSWRAHTPRTSFRQPQPFIARPRHSLASIMRRIATLQIGGEIMHRRLFLSGLAASAACVRARAAAPSTEERLALANKRLAEIGAREGGRLGVFMRDTGAGAPIEHRGDERFPMCSTFKLLAAAAALKRLDQGAERIDRTIAYGPPDLLDYAPIAKAHVAAGGMTLADLCAAAIDWSDNTAANLVLQTIGGPAGFTAFARSLGDEVTRLDTKEASPHGATP